MEKLTSVYLGEVEVEVAEIEDGKKKIPHAFLAELVHNNEICINNKVQYMYREVMLHEPGHYAAICIMSDKGGRRVEAIGESTNNTRSSTIAQNYPLLMAYNRAFDAAAIAFLGFPSGIVYSDSQIPEDAAKGDQKTSETTPAASKTKPAATPAKPAAASAKSPVGASKTAASAETAGAPAEKEETVPAQAETQSDIPPDIIPELDEDYNGPPFPTDDDAPPFMDDNYAPPATGTTPTAAASGDNDRFGIVINFGKHKNKGWTVRELAENDLGFLTWVANDMKANDKNRDQQEACRLWLAQSGGTNDADTAPPEDAPAASVNEPAASMDESAAPTNEAASPTDDDPFSLVITIGLRKEMKWTVRELAEKDFASLEWVAYESPNKEQNKAQQEACKLWIAQNQGGEEVA